MKRSIIALGCLLFAGPALAPSVGEKSGVNSVLGVEPAEALERVIDQLLAEGLVA